MIVVHIQIDDDGKVQCSASVKNQELDGIDMLTLLGGIEAAKLSLAAGRWQLLDKIQDPERGINFLPFNEDWKRIEERVMLAKEKEYLRAKKELKSKERK